MIPVRLELKNFMSYGTQVMPLDFTGMHLACLSGDNGNGKSALLDAITWALWGEARASSDELIRLGTDEMRVTFEFELGDHLYRVIRGRSKRSSGNFWEVYVAEPSGEAEGSSSTEADSPEEDVPSVSGSERNWRSLTGQGVRDTGRVIQRILRMDYRTFINSAYIQQGRADEFTRQSVADRKQILADILDLSRYDALEQKAKSRRNDADQRVQQLDREISQAEAELASEDDCKTRLAESEAAQGKLESEIADIESQLRDLQSRQSELENDSRRIAEMRKQLDGWRLEVQSLLSRKTEQEKRVEAYRKILKERDTILSGAEKLRSTLEAIARLDGLLGQQRKLEHEKAGLEQQIQSERHRLDLERRSVEKELSELENRVAAASSVEKDAEGLRARVAELDILESRRSELQSKVAESADRLGALKAQHDGLQREVKPDLEQKLEMIAEPGAKCPLCRTELSDDKHAEVVAQYQRDIQDIDRRIADLKKQGTQAKSEREAAQQELDRVNDQLKAGLDVRQRLGQLEQSLSDIEKTRKRLPEIRTSLESVSKRLDEGSFADEPRARIKAVGDEIAKLAYDADEHDRLKEQLGSLEQFDGLARDLEHAEQNLPADESNLQALVSLISAREKSIAESETAVKELSAKIGELPKVSSEVRSKEGELQSLRASDRELTGQIARLRHELERLKSLRKELGAKRKDLEAAKKDKAIYTELVAAFGKKGVQALIIENAVPEIQDEANRLLARMTDNAMQVSIETVKEKKTGGSAETLDIRISDDVGTRSYDLYSGGEAFRVNFALRIALSRLLARRAGARLQTLIIDEGFGTQDAKGREKLVESINSIKDDFEKILVITHIDELKDAFPTRIEITKDSQGSQIAVS